LQTFNSFIPTGLVVVVKVVEVTVEVLLIVGRFELVLMVLIVDDKVEPGSVVPLVFTNSVDIATFGDVSVAKIVLGMPLEEVENSFTWKIKK